MNYCFLTLLHSFPILTGKSFLILFFEVSRIYFTKSSSIIRFRVSYKRTKDLNNIKVQSVVSDFLQPHRLQHARVPCPSPTPRACSNSCPSSQWCHQAISSSFLPFSSCLHSFPGSFPMSQFFASGGQSIGVSLLASVLPMNIQDWFPWGVTNLISLQSKGLSRVFSNTTVLKHQFFSAQLSL